MGRISDAFTAHAALDTDGEINIYDISAMPTAAEAKAKLPFIVPLLGDTGAPQGYDTLSVPQGQGDMALRIGFLLAVKQPEASKASIIGADVLNLFEAYFDALRADPDLNETLDQTVMLEAPNFGVFNWNDVDWIGVKLFHRWYFMVD